MAENRIPLLNTVFEIATKAKMGKLDYMVKYIYLDGKEIGGLFVNNNSIFFDGKKYAALDYPASRYGQKTEEKVLEKWSKHINKKWIK